jgi:hypothetical protein
LAGRWPDCGALAMVGMSGAVEGFAACEAFGAWSGPKRA